MSVSDASSEPRRFHWGSEHWGVAAALAAALAVLSATALLEWRLASERQEYLQTELGIELKRAEEKVEAQLEERIRALVRMASRWESGGAPMQQLWEADAGLYYQHYQCFEAIAWADADHHVQWVVPSAHPSVAGVDMSSEARSKEALEQAQEQRVPSITRTVDLATGGKGFLVFVPIVRQERFEGTIIGVFRVRDTLETILGPDFQSRFALSAFDGSEPIYEHVPPSASEGTGPVQEGSFRIRSAQWRVLLRTAPSFTDPLRSTLPEAVLGVGVLVSVLVFAAVLQAFRARGRAQQLEAITAFHRMVLDGTHYAVMSTGADGLIRVFNKGAERLLGFSAEEVVGKVTPLAFHDQQELQERARQLSELHGRPIAANQEVFSPELSKGLASEGEWHYVRKDGSRVPVKLSLTALRDGRGQIAQFVGFAFDVTASKQAEQALVRAKEAAEETAQVKADFLARMSHEIRTPLNGVIGMVDLTLGTPLGPQQRDFLETALDSARSLLRIINDILHFSKIEARKLQLESIPFKLRDVLGETLKPLALQAHGKGLELLMDVPEQVPDGLVGDPHRLHQVLVNLLENALKFTEKGEVVVTVEREGHRPGHAQLRFSVTDTGIGIPEQKLAQVFEAFAQADEATTRKYGGTGLGLAIASQLVALMGGRLQVESKVGRGSRFYFSLELKLAADSSLRPPVLGKVELDGLPVLVAVENASHRRILAGLLKGWRMVPHAVEDSAAPPQGGLPIRLAIVEVRQSGDGEQEPARKLRADPRMRSIPLILLTATNESMLASTPGLEPCAWLIKPVSPSVLLETIQSLVTAGPSLHGLSRTGAAASARTPREVLVVEDNAVNQRIVSTFLERAGHHVALVGSGQEALEALRTRHYDVVLMDVQMPGMDGLETTRAIRSEEAQRGGRVLIIALTAQDRSGDARRCLEAGMDGYLTKPLKLANLLNAVEELSSPRVAVADAVPSSEAVLDRERLLSHVGGDTGLMKEVVDLFLAERPAIWASLEDAVARKDGQAVFRASHKVKGALLNLTASPAAAVARKLEHLGKEERLEEAAPVLEQLRHELARLQGVLEELSARA